MDPIMFNGLLMIAGIFGVPALSFALFFTWLELRDTRELADYYCEQWESLAKARREAAESDWVRSW